MSFYKLWKSEWDSCDETSSIGYGNTHLRAFCGDITKRDLGITNVEPLFNSISLVVHCAAMVNWTMPYLSHKAPNVDGTCHILALSIAANQSLNYNSREHIHFCHISTLGLLCGGVLDEVIPTPTTGLSLKGGYAQV
jgi:thioester reductase-like protein